MWNKIKKLFIREVVIEKEVVKTETKQKQIFVYTIPESALATNKTFTVKSKNETQESDGGKCFSLWMNADPEFKYDSPLPSYTQISEDLFNKVEVGDRFKLLLVKDGSDA